MVESLGQNQTQPQSVQVPNYSGVNIQIFNPSVNPGGTAPVQQPSSINASNYSTNPAYPGNYYMNNLAQPEKPQPAQQTQQAQQTPPAAAQPATEEKKKMETREVVELTDDHVKALEKYLNDQDSQVRLLGAKEIATRFQEDKSRRNDEALNALVNKMLQDPYQPVRFIGMGLIESRLASGNDQSVQLLQKIGLSKSDNGQDEIKASNALLKMSGSTTKKEFEVEDKPKAAEKKAVETEKEPKSESGK